MIIPPGPLKVMVATKTMRENHVLNLFRRATKLFHNPR